MRGGDGDGDGEGCARYLSTDEGCVSRVLILLAGSFFPSQPQQGADGERPRTHRASSGGLGLLLSSGFSRRYDHAPRPLPPLRFPPV